MGKEYSRHERNEEYIGGGFYKLLFALRIKKCFWLSGKPRMHCLFHFISLANGGLSKRL